MRASGTRKRAARITSDGMLFPLDFVYARSGVELPQVKAIDPDDIPLPYRSRLVHHTDMTLTLESHFGGRVALRPLATFLHGPWYFRRLLGRIHRRRLKCRHRLRVPRVSASSISKSEERVRCGAVARRRVDYEAGDVVSWRLRPSRNVVVFWIASRSRLPTRTS